jgi:hypothetical protein
MLVKRVSVMLCVVVLFALTGSLVAQDATTFTVRIENISAGNSQTFHNIGAFAVPVGATEMRPAMPGEAFEFTVKAAPGDYLSFATMYGESNDNFFATVEQGISLFDDNGSPVNGDVSDQIGIWDAGTEVNEPLGEGPNQAPRQPAPNTGEAESGTVEVITGQENFPASAAEAMTVTLTAVEFDEIMVRIENISDNVPVPTGFSPGVFVLHTADQTAPFFTTGEADRGQGLERIAEDGNPEELASSLAGSAVMDVSPSPGVYAVVPADQALPVFDVNQPQQGQGLESLAEDGNPEPLSQAIEGAGFEQFGIFNTALDATEAGPLMSGQAFEFTFTATPEDHLWFALMFGQSNDLFFAPDPNGITLFMPNGTPISGSITGALQLWDAGTEVNQEPFVGPDQALRQAAPNTGADEGSVVQPIYAVDDDFTYPSVFSSLRVTITPDTAM